MGSVVSLEAGSLHAELITKTIAFHLGGHNGVTESKVRLLSVICDAANGASMVRLLSVICNAANRASMVRLLSAICDAVNGASYN